MSEVGTDKEPWQRDGKPLVLAGEPVLEYQPIVDLGSGKLLGFEALLRWHHPTEGIILPSLLIPWAEANGDIVALGDWVLLQACLHAQAWPRSMQVAVNCSMVQLRRGCGSVGVEDALNTSGMEPDRLTVEITEHAMSDERAMSDLRRIAAMGVQLAVDDVGTSWNSFDLLRKMAVNTVKIDDSFVRGLEPREGINRLVVETVVHLAQSSGMATVAEGVETAVHASIVREFETDAAQGYFFAPPLSVEKAGELALLSDHRFPMEGLGWTDDDGWASVGGFATTLPGGGHVPLPGTTPVDPKGVAKQNETLQQSSGVPDDVATTAKKPPAAKKASASTKKRSGGTSKGRHAKPDDDSR